MIDKIKEELARGFTKSELERIWELPKNSLSAVLADNIKAPKKLSAKATIRLTEYFNTPIESRPSPTDKIERKPKQGTKPDKKKEAKPKNQQSDEPEYDFSEDVFLNIEKHTKFPKKDRPLVKWEIPEWEALKKAADQKIREAWNKHKAQ